MRIALFTDTYLPQTNGVVAYICDAMRALAKSHEVILFAPGEGRFRTERAPGGITIHWVPSSPFPFYEGYRIASVDYRRIASTLDAEKPDVIHAHAPINLGVQGMIAGRRRGIPVVATYHTHYPDYVPHITRGRLPSALGDLGAGAAKEAVRRIFGLADVVTAPTQELVDELRSYGLRNVVRLPNGIDFAKLRCPAAKARAFMKAHRIPQDAKTVIYLGRLSFEKRVDALLEAFRLIDDGGRLLVVAGGGPMQKRFRELAGRLGIKNVVFTGYVRNPAAAYACADVFASASDSETFGLTFVEAMHMGLPAIGVSRLGAKEVITDGKDGLLVEPGDTRALAGAMKRLLDDGMLRRRMAAQGRKTAAGYSIQNSVRRTLAIYRRLTDAGRAGDARDVPHRGD